MIDPHKHGLQPYGCGCVLFRDPSVGRLYNHDSPYTYFSSTELHLGEISLEVPRPGATAVALWATMRLLPSSAGGEFARRLAVGGRRRSPSREGFPPTGGFSGPRPAEYSTSSCGWLAAAAPASRPARARRIFDGEARAPPGRELPCAFFDLAGAGVEADREGHAPALGSS